MNSNLVTLRGRVSGADRQAISAQMRALDQACRKLLELSHPSDSPFLRRDGFSHQEAEVVHRLVSRLLSKISEAAWELGLDRTIQNASHEALSLVSNMKENAQGLLDLKSSTDRDNFIPYVREFADEALRILNDISRVVGTPQPEAYLSVGRYKS